MKKYFLNKNIATYIISITSSFIGIIFNFVLARVLQADLYGELQYYIALATAFAQVLLFGLDSFIVREAKNSRHGGELLNKAFTFYFGLCCFLMPLFFYFIQNFGNIRISNSYLQYSIVFMSIFMGINILVSQYFQGNGQYYKTIVFQNLIPKFLMLISCIVFIFIGKITTYKDYYVYFYLLIYGVIALFFLWKYFKKINFSFKFSDIKSILFFFGVTVTYSLTSELAKVLQGGVFNETTALAIISVSLNILSLVSIFANVLNNLIKPIFAKYSREDNNDAIINVYRFSTRLNSYVAIPLYIFFLTNSKHFLSIFGESYTVFPFILLILSLRDMVSTLTGPNGIMLAMTGKEKWELFNGVTNLLSFAIFAICFSGNKIYGLAFSLMLSTIIVNIMKYIEVWILFKRPPLNLKTIISLLIIFVVDFICIYFLKYIDNLLIWLPVGIVVGIVLIVVNFIISSYGKKDFKDLLLLKI